MNDINQDNPGDFSVHAFRHKQDADEYFARVEKLGLKPTREYDKDRTKPYIVSYTINAPSHQIK